MRRPTVVSLIAALALGACAHPEALPPTAEGMTWILAETGRDEPALFYGVPESDNLVLMLECRPGSGEVQITIFGPAARPARRIALASGGARASFPARSQPDELFDEVHRAVVPAASPVLARFAQTGAVAIGLNSPDPLPRAPPATSGRFVELCRA